MGTKFKYLRALVVAKLWRRLSHAATSVRVELSCELDTMKRPNWGPVGIPLLWSAVFSLCVVASVQPRAPSGVVDNRYLWGESRADGEYVIFGSDGRYLERRRFPKTVGSFEPIPDRTGYYRRHVRTRGRKTESTIEVSVDGRAVLSHLIQEPSRVAWTSLDGSSFLLQEGKALSMWSKCDGKFRTEGIDGDVFAWAVSSQSLYLLSAPHSASVNPLEIT